MTVNSTTDEPNFGLTRLGVRVIVRAVITIVVLVTVYYTLPFDGLNDAPAMMSLLLGILALGLIMSRQIHSIIKSSTPTLRAIEAVAVILPLFLLCVSSAYFLMSRSDPAAFTEALTRTDALYFTLTVFSTVGFGDISAVSQPARLAVTAQIFLDLLLLGAGLRIVVMAVNIGKKRHDGQASAP